MQLTTFLINRSNNSSTLFFFIHKSAFKYQFMNHTYSLLLFLPVRMDKVERGTVPVMQHNLQLNLCFPLWRDLLRLDVRVLVHDAERVRLGTHHPT